MTLYRLSPRLHFLVKLRFRSSCHKNFEVSELDPGAFIGELSFGGGGPVQMSVYNIDAYDILVQSGGSYVSLTQVCMR